MSAKCDQKAPALTIAFTTLTKLSQKMNTRYGLR